MPNWTDDNGVSHFMKRPPKRTEFTNREINLTKMWLNDEIGFNELCKMLERSVCGTYSFLTSVLRHMYLQTTKEKK